MKEFLAKWNLSILGEETFLKFYYIIAAFVAVFFINRFLRKNLVAQLKSNENKYRTRKVVSLFTYFLFVVFLLFIYQDKIGNIGATMGFVGAGIAFALQEVIISIAGWMTIIFTNSITVGQRVKIGEIRGDVIDIGVLSTTIMETGDWVRGDLYNGCIVKVANSFVYKEKVHNYSAEYPFLWDEIIIPIRIDSDYKKARITFQAVLENVCGDFANQSEESWKVLTDKYRIEDAKVKPMVTMSFDENWISFTLRYIVDYKKRRTTKDLIFNEILSEINASEGQISVATAAIEVTQAKG